MASDRGVDLDGELDIAPRIYRALWHILIATTTVEPERSGFAWPHRRRPQTSTSASRPSRSIRHAEPHPRVGPSHTFNTTTITQKSMLFHPHSTPRARQPSPSATTTVKRERLSSGSPSPKRSRVKRPSPASASAFTVTRAPTSITAGSSVKNSSTLTQLTAAVVPSVKDSDADTVRLDDPMRAGKVVGLQQHRL
jgi:hypothetical protein